MNITYTKNQRQAGRSLVGVIIVIAIVAIVWWNHAKQKAEREAQRKIQEAQAQIWGTVIGVGLDVLSSSLSRQEPIQREIQGYEQPTVGYVPRYDHSRTEEQFTRSTTRIYDGSGRETGRMEYDSKTGHGFIYDNTTSNPNDEMSGRRITTTPR